MRFLDKALILSFAGTVALGVLIFLYSANNDESFQQVRSQLFTNPGQLVAEGRLSFAASSRLWYGVMAIFAFVMIGVVLRMARAGELQAFKERLVAAEVAKAETESSLQDWIWKEKHARSAREATLKDLQASLDKILTLQDQLTENERLLQNRDAQLKKLRSQREPAGGSGGARGQADMQELDVLRKELEKKTELLQAKDSANKQLETHLTSQVLALETQLGAKETLLAERAKDLEALGAQLMAKRQAENLLTDQLKRERELLHAKESTIKDLEKKLAVTLQTLEADASQREGLLQSRNIELELLQAELKNTREQLAGLESTTKQTEDALRRELKRATDTFEKKDLALKQLQTTLSQTIQTFEGKLNARDKLLNDREAELEALRSEVTKLASVRSTKNQAEKVLQQNLRQHVEALQAKDAAIKELERRLNAQIYTLDADLKQKDELLQSRAAEVEAFRSDIGILRERMADLASVKEQLAARLQQALEEKTTIAQSRDAAFEELKTTFGAKLKELETELDSKNEILQQRNTELDALVAQLTGTESSRAEVEGALRQELAYLKECLDAKDATIGGLEDSVNKAVHSLRNRLSEQEMLLRSRDAVIEELKSEIVALKSAPEPRQLAAPAAEARQGTSAQAISGPRLEDLHNLELSLSEKEDLLKIQQEKIERLESELKEKRTELARHEISMWQGIERREVWKRRLAKLGIPLKD